MRWSISGPIIPSAMQLSFLILLIFLNSGIASAGCCCYPKQFNASYGDLPYRDKLDHYNTQNMLARSLHLQML